MRQTFRPSVHGWPFQNAFAVPGNQLGLGQPLAEGFGLCGGLCWTALDRFLDGRRVPKDLAAPEPGTPLYEEFVQRQVNALAQAVWQKLVDWQKRPEPRLWRGGGLAARTRRGWPALRRRLDAGEPVLLCLVRRTGGYSNPSESQQVLAYRYAYHRKSGHLSIWVYDPNRPGDDNLKLTLSMRWWRPLGAKLGGRTEVAGFFAVAYDRGAAPQIVAESFSDPARSAVNRPLVEMPTVLAGTGGAIRLFGRSSSGDLLQFEQRRGRPWRLQNISAAAKLAGPQQIDSGLAVVTGRAGKPVVLGRSVAGELICCRQRLLRGWTSVKLGGAPALGLTGDPVVLAGRGRRLNVFGKGPGGHLLHFEQRALRGWTEADLTRSSAGKASFPLDSVLVAVHDWNALPHVFGCNGHGELVHYWRGDDGEWAAENVASQCGLGEGWRIAGGLAAAPADGEIELFGRNAEGELLSFQLDDSGWSPRNLTTEQRARADELRVQSDPSVVRGSADALHLFVRGAEGDLLHYFRRGSGVWLAENVTSGRPTIGADYRFEGEPSAVSTPRGTFHIAARQGEALLLYSWRPDTDWVVENLATSRPTVGQRCRLREDAVPVCGSDGVPHVIGLDGRGCILHVAVVHASKPAWRARRGLAASHAGEAVAAARPVRVSAARPEVAAAISAEVFSSASESAPVQLDALPEQSAMAEPFAAARARAEDAPELLVEPAPARLFPADLSAADWPKPAAERYEQDSSQIEVERFAEEVRPLPEETSPLAAWHDSGAADGQDASQAHAASGEAVPDDPFSSAGGWLVLPGDEELAEEPTELTETTAAEADDLELQHWPPAPDPVQEMAAEATEQTAEPVAAEADDLGIQDIPAVLELVEDQSEEATEPAEATAVAAEALETPDWPPALESLEDKALETSEPAEPIAAEPDALDMRDLPPVLELEEDLALEAAGQPASTMPIPDWLAPLTPAGEGAGLHLPDGAFDPLAKLMAVPWPGPAEKAADSSGTGGPEPASPEPERDAAGDDSVVVADEEPAVVTDGEAAVLEAGTAEDADGAEHAELVNPPTAQAEPDEPRSGSHVLEPGTVFELAGWAPDGADLAAALKPAASAEPEALQPPAEEPELEAMEPAADLELEALEPATSAEPETLEPDALQPAEEPEPEFVASAAELGLEALEPEALEPAASAEPETLEPDALQPAEEPEPEVVASAAELALEALEPEALEPAASAEPDALQPSANLGLEAMEPGTAAEPESASEESAPEESAREEPAAAGERIVPVEDDLSGVFSLIARVRSPAGAPAGPKSGKRQAETRRSGSGPVRRKAAADLPPLSDWPYEPAVGAPAEPAESGGRDGLRRRKAAKQLSKRGDARPDLARIFDS